MQKRIADTTVDLYPPENRKFKSRLILIHGLWSNSGCWVHWATRLSNLGWECWAVNLGDRMNAQGGDAIARLTLDHCVNELKQVIQAAGPDPVIVTHDVGWIPSLMASRGEKVASLLLVSPPNPSNVPKESLGPLRSLRLKYLLVLLLGWPVQIRQKDFSHYWLSCLPVSRHQEVFSNLVPESSHLVKLLFHPSLNLDRVSDRLPALVMGGTQDPVAPIESVRRTAKNLTAECREYACHGHWLLAEEGWEEIVNDAHRWLVQGLGEAALLNPP